MSHLPANLTAEEPDGLAAQREVARDHLVRGEEGNLTILALCMFVLMAMIGGIAVDLMRYEAMRTSLQNTLDRATLAAASLSQQLDAEDVVTDYFDKAGLADYLRAVTVEILRPDRAAAVLENLLGVNLPDLVVDERDVLAVMAVGGQRRAELVDFRRELFPHHQIRRHIGGIDQSACSHLKR